MYSKGGSHFLSHSNPTKVTFTFHERHLHEEKGSVASFWRGSETDYDLQTWLAHKMRSQREKVKLERAVIRAERHLQSEYMKQMEAKRLTAEQQYRVWLKNKGFAHQAPEMLHREPVRKVNSAPVPIRPATPVARSHSLVRSTSAQGKRATPEAKPARPKTARSRKRISSTLDLAEEKPPTPKLRQKDPCKALGKDDYMKMKHLSGKRYTKLKEQKSEYKCEDELLRTLQNLEWEEKCIKNNKIFTEKKDLEAVRSKALKKKKRKMRFEGDLITVEVDELNSSDVIVTFEEIDDHCSDIGCLEKEGVDFQIESVETIDTQEITKVDTAVSSKCVEIRPPSPPPTILSSGGHLEPSSTSHPASPEDRPLSPVPCELITNKLPEQTVTLDTSREVSPTKSESSSVPTTPTTIETSPTLVDTPPTNTTTPPVTMETAPVAMETSAISTETAPVATETPPISTEMAPVATETSPVVMNSPHVITETVPVTTETPHALVEKPLAAMEMPPVAMETTPVAMETAPVAMEATPVATETPPVATETTPVATETTPVATDISLVDSKQSIPKDSDAKMESERIQQDRKKVDEKGKGVEKEGKNLDKEKKDVDVKKRDVDSSTIKVSNKGPEVIQFSKAKVIGGLETVTERSENGVESPVSF